MISSWTVAERVRAPRPICEAPAVAYARAVASPMPLEAPVMKTDLPLQLDFAGSMAG